MNHPTAAEECRDALRVARARRLEREQDTGYRQRLRDRDDAYERRALQRRTEVRPLRLADDLPHELGERRPVLNPNARGTAAAAARDHLRATGLYGETSAVVLRQMWPTA